MRRFLAISVIAAFCLTVRVSPGQVGKEPAKSDPLEELQAEALKNNADLKVEEAKLKLAQAKFERAQVQLKAQVGIAYAEFFAAQAGEKEGYERFNRAKQMYAINAISKEDLGAAQLTWQKLHSEVAVKEAHLNALVGRSGQKAVPKSAEKQPQ
jgi:hypothetical protein